MYVNEKKIVRAMSEQIIGIKIDIGRWLLVNRLDSLICDKARLSDNADFSIKIFSIR